MGTNAPPSGAGASGSPEADELQRIPGIGPVIERHLHEAGVRRYAQLAALTPEQIAGLVPHLPLLSVERIVRQDWVGRARALAREAAPHPAPGAAAGAGLHSASFTIELQLDERRNVLATRAVHLPDGASAAWDGWSAERLAAFVGAFVAGLAGWPPAEHQPQGPPPHRAIAPGEPDLSPPDDDCPSPSDDGAAAGPQLELGELSVETTFVDAAGRPLADAGLQARLPFALAGRGAGQLAAGGWPYSIAVLAADTADGTVALIGATRGRLSSGRLRYAPVLTLAPPHEGRFQLLGAVLIAEAGLAASTLGPLLSVVAGGGAGHDLDTFAEPSG